MCVCLERVFLSLCVVSGCVKVSVRLSMSMSTSVIFYVTL